MRIALKALLYKISKIMGMSQSCTHWSETMVVPLNACAHNSQTVGLSRRLST